MQKAALYTSAVIFAIGAGFHMMRLITNIEMVVGGYVLPVWISYPGILVAASLAIWMMFAARRS